MVWTRTRPSAGLWVVGIFAASGAAADPAQPSRTVLVQDHRSDSPSDFVVGVPMLSPDQGLSGVCTVGIASPYTFNHYSPEAPRIDFKLHTTGQRPETCAWVTPGEENPSAAPIYATAGTIGSEPWIEIVQLEHPDPNLLQHHLTPFDDPIIQIAADPEAPILWIHQAVEEDPPRFRLTSYEIDPDAPLLDENSILSVVEMEGELEVGTLKATPHGKAFGALRSTNPGSPNEGAVLAAGFTVPVTNTYMTNSPTAPIHLDAAALGESGEEAGYRIGLVEEGRATATLVSIEQAAGIVMEATEQEIPIDNPKGLVMTSSGAYVHDDGTVYYLPLILRNKLFDHAFEIELDQVIALFDGNPGAINNIALSLDGTTVGIVTESNPESGDGPTFFHIDTDHPTRINRPDEGNSIFYYELPAGFLNGDPLSRYGLALNGDTAILVGDNSADPADAARMAVIGYNRPPESTGDGIVSFKLSTMENETPLGTLTPTFPGPTLTPTFPTLTPTATLHEPTETPTLETLTPTLEETQVETPTPMYAVHPEFDVNGNGRIDADDLIWFMHDWMKPVRQD